MPLRPAVLRRSAAALAALLLLTLLAPNAAYAAGFRFWGYYQLSEGSWAFAQEGPAATVPADGTVEGWRFAVTEGEDARFPRAVLTFEEICADTQADAEAKRVGVVVDFGRPADAPEGEEPPEPLARCVVLPQDASALDAVSSAVEDVRVDSENGLVCGLAGYPASGCGDPVETVSEEALAADEPVAISVASSDVADDEDSGGPTENTTDGGLPVWVWLLLGVVVVGGLLLALSVGTRRGDGELEDHDAHDPHHDDEDQQHI